MPLIKNVIKPLAKSVLIPLMASAADAGVHKRILGSDKQNNTMTLIILNDEMEDIIMIVKSLDDSGLLVNIYLVYEIDRSVTSSSYPTLENFLFGAVKLKKHVNVDFHKYSEHGIGFDRKGVFSMDNEVDRNVIIFGVDMSSFSHIDNKQKDILVLGKSPTKGLEHTLTA